MTEEQAEQTPAETMEKGKAIGEAGIKAAQAEPDPAKREEAMQGAMREEADRQNIPLSDDDLKKLSKLLVGDILEGFDARGVFDGPPEPVEPPPTAPPSPGAESEPAPSETQQPPRRRSFAERFMGQ